MQTCLSDCFCMKWLCVSRVSIHTAALTFNFCTSWTLNLQELSRSSDTVPSLWLLCLCNCVTWLVSAYDAITMRQSVMSAVIWSEPGATCSWVTLLLSLQVNWANPSQISGHTATGGRWLVTYCITQESKLLLLKVDHETSSFWFSEFWLSTLKPLSENP